MNKAKSKVFAKSKTKSVDVDVDICIDEWTDEELREELNRRANAAAPQAMGDDTLTIEADRSTIERIRSMVYAGQYERASREFCDVIRNALGTAI